MISNIKQLKLTATITIIMHIQDNNKGGRFIRDRVPLRPLWKRTPANGTSKIMESMVSEL